VIIEEIEEDLIYRLKIIIKNHYKNQNVVAKSLNIAPSVISDWWKRRLTPSTSYLEKICNDTGVSMDWLVLGRHQPYIEDLLFEKIYFSTEQFSKENNIKFTPTFFLAMLRIVCSELNHNKNASVEETIKKHKEIIIALQK
jgi:transcriptional regulator with XRE-family HTH domain